MKDLILLGGIALVGFVAWKTGLLQSLGINLPDLGAPPASEATGEESLPDEEGLIEDLDGDGQPDMTPNQIASNSLSNPLVAVNFYAGKIAGMITMMSARNIYDATQIKGYLVDRHISEVEHIAQLVNYQVVKIDYTNLVALREIARLALDTGKELRIEYSVDDALALEVIGNVGRGYSEIPASNKNEMVLSNVSRYIMDRFNGAPSVRIPNDQQMINQQFQDFQNAGMETPPKTKTTTTKKSKYARAYVGWIDPASYLDLNSGYQNPALYNSGLDPKFNQLFPRYKNPYSTIYPKPYRDPFEYRPHGFYHQQYYNYPRYRPRLIYRPEPIVKTPNIYKLLPFLEMFKQFKNEFKGKSGSYKYNGKKNQNKNHGRGNWKGNSRSGGRGRSGRNYNHKKSTGRGRNYNHYNKK